jgi:phosphoglucosamine mutase
VLAIMRRRERPLSELAKVLTRSPQILVNVRVRERVDLAGIPEIGARMAAIERDLGREGRLLVRYSGTEPLVRVMIEGPDDRLIREMAEDLAELVRAMLGEDSQT